MKSTPIRKVSKKMMAQKTRERALRQELIAKCEGCCEICGIYFGNMLEKHEVKTRGQCGDALDPKNCLMLCHDDHEAQRGVKVIRANPEWSKRS